MTSYVAHEKINMRTDPQFNEKWLQAQIAEEPALVGLGDLDVRDLERAQPRAGRLDMLLQDPETQTRYEVELQLGATDESHIIRTIEYWDIERRRFPQYEHVAVIVAEDITSRFFNVISLFNGFIPIVAIQVAAIRVGDAVTLVFTKVLDQMQVGLEDEDEQAEATDRSYWETKKGTPASVQLADQMLELVHRVDPSVGLKYNKHYIGLAREGVAANFVALRPRRRHMIAEFKNPRDDELTARIEDSGLESLSPDRWSTYRISVREGDIAEHAELLTEMIRRSHQAYGAS